jgi:hypothetical protein
MTVMITENHMFSLIGAYTIANKILKTQIRVWCVEI